ncbi:MAG TPA: hypothetical protein PKD27_09150 [Tepidiformaceae bacterium]|nr:hypothetical protein [Tepidiformaceae bacterium]
MRTTTPIRTEKHAHHWRIAEVDGPISTGQCLNCGVTREFQNYPPEEPIFQARYGRRRVTAAA